MRSVDSETKYKYNECATAWQAVTGNTTRRHHESYKTPGV